ncbi:MAG: aminotransferase class I/II-fold pyridoxal phosphate-dependent enzyme [Candidatus Marinimicrobia bacterium]|nr:aminotransferase class I/II-fold pyridoxal phosphate-dependent enzyme [Candidatus Neomarinimicrobiota bacterium]MBL7010233.1 aminotransferase class I/II-fold pyridoxal phosphate-dependent enzyme [Candidatus Neomarinimicrobiota bacterium]MBL7030648.1 aminotransferase class I/II-fold pyridoxal phosphate-dependent enzyme [Candidatus Neomarinimicrobiota bacterium]
MTNKNISVDTKLIHAGEPNPRIKGAVSMPIFQSSNFEYGGETSYDSIRYIRLNNTPNHIALHQKLAEVAGADAALVTSSGMSAITTALLAYLKSGDHIMAHHTLYGGTADYIVHDLPKYGIDFDFFDAMNPANWESKLKPNTKVIYVETITNPLMDVPKLDAVVQFAKKHNLVSLIDNTFASPLLYSPIKHGFDISLHSATKYLNGHSDIVAGVVIGSQEHITQVNSKLIHLGGSLDPNACFLLHRGIKTLSLRMERQCENAMKIARFLEDHPKILRVNYPGLESNRSHENAKKYLCGFGAMVSFELDGDVASADAFINRLEYAINAASLGGVETLITRPVQTSHSLMSTSERKKAGISDTLIRYSVGIESADDLIGDLKQALE